MIDHFPCCIVGRYFPIMSLSLRPSEIEIVPPGLLNHLKEGCFLSIIPVPIDPGVTLVLCVTGVFGFLFKGFPYLVI